MNDSQKKVYSEIKGIMKICKDGEVGYRNAAERIEEESTSTLFLRLSQQRKAFYSELEREVEIFFGEAPLPGTSIKGDMHHIWQDVKATFTGNSAEEIIEECIRGEKAALKEYETVLIKQEMPLAFQEILAKQGSLIKSALAQMELLETAVD
ncbi:ferritin-like domain-containing protein [Chondrinema litorale]|uniref:ferritin-like domain-containing protein n=1 Tax=Chondrinema litorale TaxID=2994555 RepID=UPI0025436F3C|nr:PA2169 family four-helix-bundle protein [Chondrinema litorale]UZR98272.1 PA2169 family four-helix-bundle protein [Chondrinema litorale]